MAFSKYMKNLRKENNISQVKMAEILDISVTALKLIENGTTKFPGEKVLGNLCEFMGYKEVDAITNILFTDEDLEVGTPRYATCRYLAYMYLQGWNIEKSPYEHSLWTKKNIIFDGRMSKKRDLKNIQLVSSYDRFLDGNTLQTREDALAFIMNVASSVVTVLAPFKGIHIVFDGDLDKQIHMYDLFEDEMIGHIDFDVEIVIFNTDEGFVIGRKNVRKK